MSTRNFISMANKYDRIVLLVDMDCFYCQVEEKLDPTLKGKPMAVVQYNAWRGGGIIAVNYAARDKGVTRHMRGEDAKLQCPEIELVKVPNVREKADLTKYRDAGKQVASVLQRFTPLLERASVDEAYMDITDAVNKRFQALNEASFVLQPQELVNTYAVGFESIGQFVTTITSCYNNPIEDDNEFYRKFNENDVPAVRQSNIRLLIGASIANEIRSAVKSDTGYECSAGIAHNKILAKLACGMNKPNKQTLLPLAQIDELFQSLPIGKIKGLGAKFGEELCERLNIRFVGQLMKFTEAELQKKFDEKNGSWLYNLCRGIDLEAVTPRFSSKSIGCCKKFPGRNNITGFKTLQHWIKELATEINDRLEKDIFENNRRAKQMVVNYIQEFDGEEVSSSRSCPLSSYDTEQIAKSSLELIKLNTKQFFRSGNEGVLNNPIKFLGINVGKFETISSSKNNIQNMFAQQAAKNKITAIEEKLDKPIEVNETITDRSQEPSCSNNRTNKQDVRSFFLNAIKKRTNIQKNQIVAPEQDVQFIKETDSNANNLQMNNANKCVNLPTDNSNHTVDLVPPKANGFFAKVLKTTNTDAFEYSNAANNKVSEASEFLNSNKSGKLTLLSSSEQKTIKVRDIRQFLQEQQHTQNDSDAASECQELNDLINDIQTIQNESSTNLTNNMSAIDLKNSEDSNTSSKRKFVEMFERSDTTIPNVIKDYRAEYAEFAIPQFNPEFLKYTNCSKCGAKILNDQLSTQTHQDHHFAQELSQQQRSEFREEIKNKINSSQSPQSTAAHPKKRSKKSQTLVPSKKTTNLDITKFLTKPQDSSFTAIASDMEICDICKMPIKLVDMLQHKDFHIAKNLQRELNKLNVQTVVVKNLNDTESSKRNLNATLKSNVKPITQFFTQSNL